MKRIALMAAVTLIYASATYAHSERELAENELKDNCVACCLAARYSVRAELKLNEDKCVTACGFLVSGIIERINED